MDPTLGLIVHVTAVFGLWFTCAVYCCVWHAFRFWLDGLTLIVIGPRVIVAVAVFDVLLVRTAVRVTVVCVGITNGAVYRPLLEIVPVLGLMDHVTLVVAWPPSNAVNCCVPVANRF